MVKLRAGLAVFALLAGGCAKNSGEIEIVALPAVDTASTPSHAEGYQAAFAAIMKGFGKTLGPPRADVKLVLFPNTRSFEEGLLASGYPPGLARSASSFAAIGGARAVLVNAGAVNHFNRTKRIQLLAHELVHTLQYQYSGGSRGASAQWLREGFAEWVSYEITSNLGLAPFHSLREDLLAPLANARFGVPPAPLDKLVTFPQWVAAQSQYELLLYAQAFVAAELLIELRSVQAIVGYFERFKLTSDHERAFADAFGLERTEFERVFVRRWNETVLRSRTGRR